MVAETYDAAMIRIFADEGGYTDDAADPGGATNFGITIFDARKYWKPNATKADVKAMPKTVAADIYRKHYADPLRYSDLPAGFDYSVLDAGVNSGTGRAVPWACKALNVPAQDIIGVVAAAKAVNDKVSLIQRYWAIRLSFLQGLKIFANFGRGWTRRCTQGEAAAVRMWLAVGAHATGSEARDVLNKQATTAKTQSKTAATAGAGSAGAGAATQHPTLDLTHLGMGGKVATAILISAAIVLVIYFVRQAIIHNMRAQAYAAA